MKYKRPTEKTVNDARQSGYERGKLDVAMECLYILEKESAIGIYDLIKYLKDLVKG